MTPISLIAATLIAVTFGWVPAEQATYQAQKPVAEAETEQAESTEQTPKKDDAEQEADPSSYEYLVQLTPTDLQALLDGRAPSLSSRIPDQLGRIETVRITIGSDPAPRKLTAVDRAKQGPAAEDPERRTAAKPVIPEWPAAAEVTAQRYEAYQNPGTLEEGFQQGTRPLTEGAEWLRRETTAAGERIRSSAERSGEAIKRSTQELLNGTGEALGALDPRRPQDANAARDSVDQYGRPTTAMPPAYDPNARTPLPTPAETSEAYERRPAYTQPNYAEQTQAYDTRQSPPLREPAESRSVQSDFDDRRFESSQQEGPALPQAGNGTREDSIIKRYTDENADRYATPRRRDLTPVAREDRNSDSAQNRREGSVTDGFDRGDSYRVGREDNDAGFRDSSTNDDFGGFPDLPERDRDSAWDEPPRTTTTKVDSSNWASLPDDSPRDSLDDPEPTSKSNEAAVVNDARGDYFTRLLLVILGGATCFTWIAYIDVRNKYRAALRGQPTSGFGHGVSV